MNRQVQNLCKELNIPEGVLAGMLELTTKSLLAKGPHKLRDPRVKALAKAIKEIKKTGIRRELLLNYLDTYEYYVNFYDKDSIRLPLMTCIVENPDLVLTRPWETYFREN